MTWIDTPNGYLTLFPDELAQAPKITNRLKIYPHTKTLLVIVASHHRSFFLFTHTLTHTHDGGIKPVTSQHVMSLPTTRPTLIPQLHITDPKCLFKQIFTCCNFTIMNQNLYNTPLPLDLFSIWELFSLQTDTIWKVWKKCTRLYIRQSVW